jgi:putative ABC transport system permease protein
MTGFRFARRCARGGALGLALTVLALACGVALVCAIDIVNRAVGRAFSEVIDTMAGRAAIEVSTGSTGLFPEELADTVAAVPGVAVAVPVVGAVASTVDGSRELLTVHGVELGSEAAVRVYEARDAGGLELADPLTFLNQPDSIMLTRAFAQRHRLRIDDAIELDTPTGHRRFTVRALLEPTGIARVYGGTLLVMDLDAAEAAFTRPGFVNRIDVVVDRDAEVDRVAAAIAAALPSGLRVQRPEQRKADLQAAMRALQLLLQSFALVALVTAGLIAFSRLSVVFSARAWQIGVLRASGVRRRVVWRELVKESALLGAVGVAIGIPAGIGLARLILPVIATTTALNFKLVAPQTELQVRPASLLLAALLGIGAAVGAALLPAWRAARVSIVDTIRSRGGEADAAPRRGALALCAGLAVALAAALTVQWQTRNAVWGLIATGLVAVVTALAARPLFLVATRTALAALAARLAPTARLATATAAQSPRRCALCVALLGVGLGSVLWLGTIAHSFGATTVGVLSQAMRADLVVGSSHIGVAYLEVPVDGGLAGEVAALDGVQSVVAVRLTDWTYRGETIALDAFDPEYFTADTHGRWPLLGHPSADVWEAVARGEAVIASSNFLQNLQARVGDRITLDTPNGPLTLRVAAETSDFASPRGTLEMSRAAYERWWNDPQITRLLVRTVRADDAARVRDAISGSIGRRHDLRILSSGELIEYFAEQVRRAFAPVDVLSGMTLLVVLLGLADNLTASVAERTRELGIARAVGLRRRQLRHLVVAESLLIGGIGLLLAVAAGLALGLLWVETTFPYLLGWVIEFRIPYAQFAFVLAVTVAICLAAAWSPARWAARLDPAAALRWE